MCVLRYTFVDKTKYLMPGVTMVHFLHSILSYFNPDKSSEYLCSHVGHKTKRLSVHLCSLGKIEDLQVAAGQSRIRLLKGPLKIVLL